MHNRSHTLEPRARQLRSALTESEAALWKLLSAGKARVWFKRQVVVGSFIVDFLGPARKVVVEVDGGYHVARGAADARRDRKLARLGYRVVRLEAELVLRRPRVARECMLAALEGPP
jgi:very-short-patch-repair endonuclease